MTFLAIKITANMVSKHVYKEGSCAVDLAKSSSNLIITDNPLRRSLLHTIVKGLAFLANHGCTATDRRSFGLRHNERKRYTDAH